MLKDCDDTLMKCRWKELLRSVVSLDPCFPYRLMACRQNRHLPCSAGVSYEVHRYFLSGWHFLFWTTLNKTKTLELPHPVVSCQNWNSFTNAITMVERLLHRKLWMYSPDSKIRTILGRADFSLSKIRLSFAFYHDSFLSGYGQTFSPMERVRFWKVSVRRQNR